ncbi:MAG TPA: thiamine pyrophosphate-binding protein [Smithellaceae bacterium]|jgi:acetolactate synthase-1/2/3 large subunit|nr:thiamine pyrophosphate-binding protein [Smithellaceae bacterium]
MIKLSDYIFQYLADYGVKHVFMLTGGGAMHLNDSVGKEKRIQYICNHHEQACAMAAEGYARVSGKIGVVSVTTGPGGTNAMTGVLGQWLDSIPALYISGQVRFDTTVASTGLPLRQLGDQEINIIDIVRPITKYAVMVTDPQSIRFHLEKAIYLATTGRFGPVWLDIPLNVQAAMIDEKSIQSYIPTGGDKIEFDAGKIESTVNVVVDKIKASKRPVILAGAGIRLGGAYGIFQQVIDKLGVPVLTAWDAIDLMHDEHPLYFGRPGTLGQRGANFIFQNADLLLSLGCRLNTRQIGFNFDSVARAAYKIILDIDPNELAKQTIRPDLPIHCDVRPFLETMNTKLNAGPLLQRKDWIWWCKERKDRYPVVLPEYRKVKKQVNPYVFCDVLSDYLDEQDIIVSSNGSSCVIPIQSLRLEKGQRHIVNSGCAAMGYGLPSAIGACFADKNRRVICLDGDGSIQLNIQELQTVAHHQLPLKIFMFNNDGYLSIRTTQKNFFNGHFVGESPKSGVTFPDMIKIAGAYGIKTCRISKQNELPRKIEEAINCSGPVFCDVMMQSDQLFAPRSSSQRLPGGRMISKPLEDMYPFLERSELLSNMLIDLWDQ